MNGKVVMRRNRVVEGYITVVFLWRRKNPKISRGTV